MIEKSDILHKTTYVWKEEHGYVTVIKNDGGKVILNEENALVWKYINDDDDIESICNKILSVSEISVERLQAIIENFIKIGIVSNEDLFWGE